MAESVKIDHGALQAYLDGDNGVEELLHEAADRVLQAAEEGAPVESGDYQESLEIVTEFTDRTVKRVVANVDYALVVEANTGNLARALDAAG